MGRSFRILFSFPIQLLGTLAVVYAAGAWSTTIEVQTPARPTALSSPLQVYVDWSANPEISLPGYHVYRTVVDDAGNALGEPERLTEVPVDTLEYADDSIERDVYYVYQISAVSALGDESALSEPSAPPVRGQWLTVFFPIIRFPSEGMNLWRDSHTGRDLIRIPVAVRCAYDISVIGMQVGAIFPATFFDQAVFRVETTGITGGMMYAANLWESDAPEELSLCIASVDISGLTLYGAGEIFSVYVAPRMEAEPGCGVLEIQGSRESCHTEMYNDPWAAPIPLALENGQYCFEPADKDAMKTLTREEVRRILDIVVGGEDHALSEAWDVNYDGRVNMQDLTLMLRYVEGLPINPPRYKDTSALCDTSFSSMAMKISKGDADAPQVWIDVPGTVAPEEEFVVSLRIDGAVPLSGYSADLSFSLDQLALVSADGGSSLNPCDYLFAHHLETVDGATGLTGVLALAAIGTSSINKGAGAELAVVRFKRIAGADVAPPVTLNGFVMNDEYGHAPRHTDPAAPLVQKSLPVPATVMCAVTDARTNAPVKNATVTVTSPAHMRVTDNVNGVYTVPQLPAGRCSLRAEAPGYHAQSLQLTVSHGQLATVSASMTPVAQEREGEGESPGEGEGEGERSDEGEGEGERSDEGEGEGERSGEGEGEGERFGEGEGEGERFGEGEGEGEKGSGTRGCRGSDPQQRRFSPEGKRSLADYLLTGLSLLTLSAFSRRQWR